MVICLERRADLHMAQLMPLPLTVSCFSKIQIGFTFLVLAHPGRRGQRAVKRLCVCVCVRACVRVCDICCGGSNLFYFILAITAQFGSRQYVFVELLIINIQWHLKLLFIHV